MNKDSGLLAAQQATSQQKIKEHNTLLLFNRIRNSTSTSRATLASETGLSPTTVSLLVDELIQRKWVRETGVGVSNMPGRKPILLEVDAAGGSVATVEIISKGFICTLYDICCKKLSSSTIHAPLDSAEKIINEIYLLMKAKRIPRYKLKGIHLIFPGVFDCDTGKICFSAVIPTEITPAVDLVPDLRAALPLVNILISNNMQVLAFTEFGPDTYTPGSRLLTISITEGIGASMVLGTNPLDISRYYTLEIGHMIVDRNGVPCKCGNRGCLETVCSISALIASVNARMGLKFSYTRTFGDERNVSALEKIAALFQQGDECIEAILREYTHTLCSALISLINLHDIRVIHIGGHILLLGPKFLDLVRNILFNDFHPIHTKNITLAASTADFETLRQAAVLMSLNEIFMHVEG